MTSRLILFTRYPEPHVTKTRLIPVLGADGAAQLQRELTRHLLNNVRDFADDESGRVEVRFDGGNQQKMEACFGNGIMYRPQGPGDLGKRLQRAIADAFSEGTDRVIVIGADCPEVDSPLIAEADACLADDDLVLGPAHDGGYYLIGLRKPTPQLFDGIQWGSDRVFDQTVDRARNLFMSISVLRTLSDVDRPEDLAVWHRIQHLRQQPAVDTISVVIPTLNHADSLPDSLVSLRGAHNIEKIVVDGGSQDDSIGIAERDRCRVVRASPGRARQFNAGASITTGSIILFLHADTRLPQEFESEIRECLADRHVVGGAFRLNIDAPGRSLRFIERAVDLRSRLLQMPYGDQGIFVRREVFDALGGFPELPVMDDFEFVRRLRRHGTIRIASTAVLTSASRWQQLGPWRTTWLNQKIILAYYLGVSTDRLARWYRRAVDRSS